MNKEKKKDLIKETIYDVIFEQVKGLIEIEIGNNYLFKNFGQKYYLEFERGSGLDAYIHKIGYIYNVFDMPDDDLILHLHCDDFLYFIVNFKDKKQEMIDFIDKYISKEGE